MRSDSIQDLSFVRDADRFSSVTKHLNDNYLRTAATSAQPDLQREIPSAGLSGLYFVSFVVVFVKFLHMSRGCVSMQTTEEHQ